MTIKDRMFSDECVLNKYSLQQINWLEVLNNDLANEFYEFSQSILLSSSNEHFPLKTRNIFPKVYRKAWITPGKLIFIPSKQRLEKKAQNRPDHYPIPGLQKLPYQINSNYHAVTNAIITYLNLSSK